MQAAKLWNDCERFRLRRGQGRVVGAEMLGDRLGMAGLVELSLGKADGKGAGRRAYAHRGDHGGGVNAPREEGTDRHVGDLAEAHGIGDERGERLLSLGLRVDGAATTPLGVSVIRLAGAPSAASSAHTARLLLIRASIRACSQRSSRSACGCAAA